jgi:hypothetical protein
MAQADQTVQNATFPTVRADINNNLAALFTDSSGATAPTVTVAFQDWIDTSGTNPLWKKRNAANNAWITIGTIIGSAIAFEGASTLPSQSGNSGKFLTTNGTAASWAALAQNDVQTFLTSGTWVKPSSGTFAFVRIWGGGGSGGRQAAAGGGGGGACNEGLYKLADMPATCTVTVGAGGAGRSTDGGGSTGGTSSFSGTGITTLFAFGGNGGGATSSSGGSSGGVGGGNLAANGVGTGSMFTGGSYGFGSTDGGNSSFGGAGGGGEVSNNGTDGGNAYAGGGGGGGGGNGGGSGGTSLFGGNGSAGSNGGSAAGSVPGGGSGGSDATTGAGGDGKVEVFVW